MVFFEQGVSARRTASLPVRAARLAPRLEAFFQSGEGRRNEMLARAMANTSHPMHNFARRWNAGEVQTFAQQLELITDRADASSNLLASGAEFIQNNAVTRRLEAHADAMENAVRQAVVDVLEETYVEQGLSPEEAQRRAYEQGISLLDFAQRSDVGETVQPFVPFAQSAITGASAMIERRIWRGGQPPVSAQSTYIDDDGKVRYSVDWNQVLRQLNWPMMASLTAAGFFNVMLMGSTAGIAWNLLGDDDEDEIDAEARGDIEKIRGKYIGPSEDAEAQTWLVENLNAAARKWVHRDAEIDTLDELKIASVLSGWVMPWQTDDRQGAAPISYGIVSQFVNLGQAAALIALGKEPNRVAAAYTNSTIRNLTPLDAPYNDTPQGVGEFMMMAIPPTFSQIYEWVQGETLDGIRLRNESPFDLGPTPYGPSNTPRFTQSLAFNEALFDLGVTMQEAGHDMGIPWAGTLLRRSLPDGARLENLMTDVPVIGQHMADALRETENIMMENASRGDDLYDAGDAARWLGDRVLVGSGFAKRDPQKAARTDYYEQLRWSGWDDLATYDRDTLRGIEYENSDYNEIRKAVGSIQGLMQRQEGLAKKEQLRIYTEEYKTAQTQEDRAEAMRKMDEIENGVDARFRAAAETLRRMKAHVNRTAPRIVGD